MWSREDEDMVVTDPTTSHKPISPASACESVIMKSSAGGSREGRAGFWHGGKTTWNACLLHQSAWVQVPALLPALASHWCTLWEAAADDSRGRASATHMGDSWMQAGAAPAAVGIEGMN